MTSIQRTARAVLLLVVFSACERQREPARESQYQAPPATMPGPAVTTAEPEVQVNVHLEAAHENFAKRNMAKAAEELRLAATTLKRAAETAPAAARQSLLDSGRELESAERDVRSGALTSVEKLDRHLAKANASLARFHYLKATEAWTAGETRTAGRELGAAVDQLEAGSKHLGQTVKGEAAKLGSQARDLGRKLTAGTQVAATDVDRTFKAVGREVDRLVERARASM